jgi:hypothetical protein
MLFKFWTEGLELCFLDFWNTCAKRTGIQSLLEGYAKIGDVNQLNKGRLPGLHHTLGASSRNFDKDWSRVGFAGGKNLPGLTNSHSILLFLTYSLWTFRGNGWLK